MKLLLLGSGPTSLGACYRLNELIKAGKIKEEDVEITVLEKEETAGGLARSIKDDNGFYWDLGGHVGFSHYRYYDDALDWATDEWHYITRNAKLDMSFLWGRRDLHLLPYPIQYSIALFPDAEKESSIKELRALHSVNQNDLPKPKTYDEWALRGFGETLTKHFFRPYNRKVWTVNIDRMNCIWVGDRVAQMDLKLLEKLCAMEKSELESQDFGWGPNAKFRFPKYGGTGGCWTDLQQKLPQKWFKFQHTVEKIDPEGKFVIARDSSGAEKKLWYDKLISTLPLDLALTQYTSLLPSINLTHNRVICIGFGIKLPAPPFIKDKSWMYFPGADVPFYRLTVLSNYSGHVTPDPSKYWSLLLEIGRATEEDGTWTEKELVESSKETIIRKGFAKAEDIVSEWVMTLPYGYPVPMVERDEELARGQKILEAKEIYSRGRFGGWKYEVANQDHSFMQGKEVLDRILFNTPEEVYNSCP